MTSLSFGCSFLYTFTKKKETTKFLYQKMSYICEIWQIMFFWPRYDLVKEDFNALTFFIYFFILALLVLGYFILSFTKLQ